FCFSTDHQRCRVALLLSFFYALFLGLLTLCSQRILLCAHKAHIDCALLFGVFLASSSVFKHNFCASISWIFSDQRSPLVFFFATLPKNVLLSDLNVFFLDGPFFCVCTDALHS